MSKLLKHLLKKKNKHLLMPNKMVRFLSWMTRVELYI